MSAATFEGRRVFMRDIRGCTHGWLGNEAKEQIVVVADKHAGQFREPNEWHPGCEAPEGTASPNVITLWTDDPAEAQAAFDRGAEWVRTGKMPGEETPA